mmetsp:Transcript_33886/g.61180  ORF Transcript_33886/g.61180 Transcript_33886/m.61180 type:complete len:415 (-) Transcript_33886:857-2101(-)|eukprot:CAMPEP_0175079902 /NCGR_PEP_ID=MMETSP0052_2-20121109/25143_1 /TAXON_ID=51329 ORGANISM="Polytomella parva, Strain SAG 63-3" /NCGR_SAMPLE_ID=MMETSP0052_2 /ASSEMBLY_ACC=CAM_ASM_000194 /LENGTH=414 /DNA_ID=CAMNT_0016350409 /DNA_START=299 /DNA_END=1543 /DNA_ORIENTATION=+
MFDSPEFFFEGSEKRLEIDFNLDAKMSPVNGLRDIPRPMLDFLMEKSGCCIKSAPENLDFFDAYVLSESSLFVYPDKWVLKTCGNTQLLECIPYLLQEAAKRHMKPRRCKYSRASFIRPEKQPEDYRCFTVESQLLDERFYGVLGPSETVILGKSNLDRLQWHVYIAHEPSEHINAPNATPSPPPVPTYNFEICMRGMSHDAASKFLFHDELKGLPEDSEVLQDHNLPKLLGIDRLLVHRNTDVAQDSAIRMLDGYKFTPCGYSLNGVLKSTLLSIHVTPEDHQSYASVEVSGPVTEMVDVIGLLRETVKIFEPRHVYYAMTIEHDETGYAANLSAVDDLLGDFDIEHVNGYTFSADEAGELLTHGAEVAGSVVRYFLLHREDRPSSPIYFIGKDAPIAQAPSSPTSVMEAEFY